MKLYLNLTNQFQESVLLASRKVVLSVSELIVFDNVKFLSKAGVSSWSPERYLERVVKER